MSLARQARALLPRAAASRLVGLALAATLPPARAEPEPRPGGWLEWRAPTGCATAEAVRERVAQLLGEPELGRVRRVEGRVRETRGGWSLRLSVIGAAGQRERRLEAATCDDLAEAAAVAITLAFEAEREEAEREEAEREEAEREEAEREEAEREEAEREEAEREEAEREEAEREEAEREAQRPSADRQSGRETASEPGSAPLAREARPSPAEARPLAVWLGLELVVDTQAVAVVAPGASLRAAVRARDLELGAYLAVWPAGELSVAPGQSVSFALAAAGVRGCVALGHGLVDTALCAGFEAGRLSASGAGLQQGREVHDLWLAPHLGLELRGQVVAGFELQARGEAVAPLLRQGYAVNAVDDVHHVASLGARVAAGLLLGF